MQPKFQLGKDVCRQLGISPEELARACHTGEVTAYRFEERMPILTPNKCRTKFKFPANSIFTLGTPAEPCVRAIGKKNEENFQLIVERKFDHLDNRKLSPKPTRDFRQAVLDAGRICARKRRDGRRELTLVHTRGKYSLYYNTITVNPTARLPRMNIVREDLPVKLVKISLYSTEDVLFEAKKAGVFDIDFLEIRKSTEIERFHLCQQVTTVRVERVYDSVGEKFVIAEWDRDKICIQTGVFACKSCDMSVNHEKNCINKNSGLCRISLVQNGVNYFRQEDTQCVTPLKLGVDFFIFDYSEYAQQVNDIDGEWGSKNTFYEIVQNFAYDTSELLKVGSFGASFLRHEDDPRTYMAIKCTELIRKHQHDDDCIRTIKAYRFAIEYGKVTWVEVHRVFWPERTQGEATNNSFISRELAKFEDIAKANGIPYIAASRLRDMDEKTRPQIVEDMARQLENYMLSEEQAD